MTPEQSIRTIKRQICCLQNELNIPLPLVAGDFLTNDGTTLSWAAGGSTPISSLLAATGTNIIDNTTFGQLWKWNTLSGTTALVLQTTSTAASGNLQKMLQISMINANATSTQTTFGLDISNGHSGTASTNIAARFSSVNGTNNYALIIPSSGGSVGIGTSTPVASSLLEMTSTTQGFLPPRMTTVQRNAIGSPAEGLIVYDTDIKTPFFYNGTAWVGM